MEAENIVDKKRTEGTSYMGVYFAVYSGVFCVYVVV